MFKFISDFINLRKKGDELDVLIENLKEKMDDLFEENYKNEEEIVENKSEETDLSQPLQWEDYMHPEFPWHNRSLWINNPKAVNFWMSAKGGTAKELNKLRKEEENTKTY